MGFVILAHYLGIQMQIEQNHCDKALIRCQSSVLLQIGYTGFCLTQKIKRRQIPALSYASQLKSIFV